MEIKTIIHNRTSTEEQNPENQLKDCLSLHKEEYGEYKIFEEKQSAWDERKARPIFEEELKLIKSGKIRYFICWDLDRIYRNRKKLLGFFEFCKMYKCSILSYRQTFLNEIQELKLPSGFEFLKDMMINNFLQFLGWIAEDESKKKSDRVKIAVRREEGKPTKSYNGKKWGRPSVHTNKIKVILDWYNQGLSYRQIKEKTNLSIGKISQIINVHKSKTESNEQNKEITPKINLFNNSPINEQ